VIVENIAPREAGGETEFPQNHVRFPVGARRAARLMPWTAPTTPYSAASRSPI